MNDELERESGNHTYYVEIKLGNLTEKQLDALSNFIGKLEINGVDCKAFDIEND